MNELARKFFPGFQQQLESVYDLPQAICIGDFVPIVRPTVYFKIDVIDGQIYSLFCLYWYRDVNHKNDFTGFIRRNDEQKVFARWHWDFREIILPICYSGGDHNPIPIEPDFTTVHYKGDVDFADMTDPRFKDASKPIFGAGCTPPWTWMSPRIRDNGLIWNSPAEFFRRMEL